MIEARSSGVWSVNKVGRLTAALAGLFVAGALAGCVSGRGMSDGGGGGDYHTFFVSEGVTQYYIKPMEFESDDEDMNLDITFRVGPATSDSAVVNFTVEGDRILKKVDVLTIDNGMDSVSTTATRNMFTEDRSGTIFARFTNSVPRSGLLSLFQKPEWKVRLKTGDTTVIYKATGSTRSTISSMERSLLRILRAE